MIPEKIADKLHKEPNFYTLLACLIAGFFLHINMFSHSWTFDDYFVILGNPDVTSLTDFFRNSYPGRPIRELSAMLDYSIFGFSPAGWHIQNILWHSLNAWLVFVLSTLLLEEKRIAWIASTLFLVHPLHVEVVAQVSHRKDSLSLLFMLLSFIFYLLFRQKGDKKYLAAVCFTFPLAILSKQNAIILPVVMLLFDIFSTNRLYRERLFEKRIVWLLLSGTVILLPLYMNSVNFTGRAEMLLTSNNYFGGFSWSAYLFAILNSWGFIFLKLVLPFDLAVNYVLEVPESILTPQILFTLVSIVAYLFLLMSILRRNSYLFFALLWFGLLFLPTANLLPVNHLAADRYMYAPSVGFFMGTSYLLNNYVVKKNIRFFLVCFIVVFFATLTFKQNSVWSSNATLWTHSMIVNSTSARAISNSGRALYATDDDRNLALQLHAASINPKDPFVQMEIGKIMEKRGEASKAKEYYKTAQALLKNQAGGMYKNIYRELEGKLVDYGPRE